MDSLERIIERNKQAVAQGVIEPGRAVGTRKLYNIIKQGKVVAGPYTLAECAPWRDALNEDRVSLQPVDSE